MIQALRQRFENVYVLANRKFAGLSSTSSETGAILALDDADLASFFVRDAELPARWRDLFSQQDLIVSYLHDPAKVFEQNVRSCGAKMFVVGPHQIDASAHATEQLARPLAQLGISLLDVEPRLEFLPAESAGSSSIALHPGSGGQRKNWPIENWLVLIDHLLADDRLVYIIGGEADEIEVARVRERFADRVQYVIDWPLPKLARLLARAIFIGHDSGISHLAAAAGAHCTLLFGPTEPEVWAPQNRSVRVLAAPDADLSRLTPAQVFAALEL